MVPSLLTVLLQPWVLHGKEVVIAALGWTVVQIVSAPFIGRYVPRGDPKKKDDRGLRVSATLHAIVAVVLSLFALLESDSDIQRDRLFGTTYWSELTMIVSSGYFLWDTVVVLIFQEEATFLLHAVGCLFMYMNCLYPFIQYYGCVFLLYELSTPFMHLRTFMIQAKNSDGKMFFAAQLAFAITFFLARILIGLPTLWGWIQEMWHYYLSEQAHSSDLVLLYLFFGISLNTLNVYWFAGILQRAINMKKKSKSSPSSSSSTTSTSKRRD